MGILLLDLPVSVCLNVPSANWEGAMPAVHLAREGLPHFFCFSLFFWHSRLCAHMQEAAVLMPVLKEAAMPVLCSCICCFFTSYSFPTVKTSTNAECSGVRTVH